MFKKASVTKAGLAKQSTSGNDFTMAARTIKKGKKKMGKEKGEKAC